MPFEEFKVLLDPVKESFLSGDEVTGYVQVASSSKMSVKDISMTVRGCSTVEWFTGMKPRRVKHASMEEYFCFSVNMWTGPNKLKDGTHRFPFKFHLPPNIPSSFEGKYGNVRYSLTVKATMPTLQKDQKLELFLKVGSVYDLNEDEVYKIPASLGGYHKPGFPFLKQEDVIYVDVHSDKSGYAPGEKIVFSGEITNHSRVKIKLSEAALVQEITYRTVEDKTKDESNLITTTKRGAVPAGKTDRWEDEVIVIPALPPTSLKHCNFIYVKYFLQFSLEFSMLSSWSTRQEITIGTLPVVDAGACSKSPIPTVIPVTDIPNPFPHVYPDLPPPYPGSPILEEEFIIPDKK